MPRPMDLLNARVTMPSLEAQTRLQAELRELAAQARYREEDAKPMTLAQHDNVRRGIAYRQRLAGLGEAS
ncbi:hypothetical protein DFO67_108179 [Modicisalibacter xianhensis]|uniref:Uncharacterized protein n=1 Tax=Modicisalibacter xianhensis TaxID=442341 RepID=A0A4R8FRD8_9GAMM|nr:hypothetical protein [Halomonas xianhensis]TDX29135.1 hypothetical protein DFO67_108179 [Halomonas xianhensis]